MNSEEVHLREENSLKKNNKLLKREKENELNKKQNISFNEGSNIKKYSLINVRQITSLSISIVNDFSIAICLIIYGFYSLEWFKIEKKESLQFYLGYFLFSGIILYIFGIFNWYEGKKLIFLIDLCLSFYFSIIYFKNKKFLSFATYVDDNNNKLQGLFYILLFCFLLIIAISSKDKKIIYCIDYGVLFVTFVLLFEYKFFKTKIIKTIGGYAFIVSGALFWITGILKLFNIFDE